MILWIRRRSNEEFNFFESTTGKIMRTFFLIFVLTASLAAATNITDLTCEYLENPLGIDVLQPRLSWKIESDERNQVQTAYQVLVAGSEILLAKNHGDIWDSGHVNSDHSLFIQFDGKPVQSGRRYYWKARVWDKKGKPSNWSIPAWWEMGLLQPTDWCAEWISAPRVLNWVELNQRRSAMSAVAPPELDEPAPLFCKSFSLPKLVKSARAYISGLGYYELRLNSNRVGDHLLDPAFTRYDKRALYVTYDITEQLKTGENVVGVILGNGWYDMPSRGVWGFDRAYWRDDPACRCQLVFDYEDGSREILVSDKSWKCADGPITFNSIRQGEFYDARLEQNGWDCAEFDDGAWQPVRLVRGPEGVLSAQMLPPIKNMQQLKPVSLTTINDSVFVLDFGQSMAGFISMRAQGARGKGVTFVYGERLDERGFVDQNDISGLVKSSPFQTDQYIFKGEGLEEWQPRFVYHGFRWVEVRGFPGKPSPELFTANVVHTSFAVSGSFACSNELLNQIQHNTLWSFKSNFHGYPTDCPHREKNGWTGDAHLAAETGLYNFAVQSAYTKWIRDFSDEQQPSGEIPAIIPTGGWGYYWGNGPAWDSALILIPWYLYVYSGDLGILSSAYTSMKRYVDFLSTRAENHLVSWGLGDWCPVRTQVPPIVTSTGYYYKDVSTLAQIAALLGKSEDAAKYTALAAEIRNAFNTTFYDSLSGNIADGSQTALTCALYQGLVEEKNTERIVNLLEKKLQQSDLNFDCGILGTKYLFNVLSTFDKQELAYSRINSTAYPGWGYWLTKGATTLWESWDGSASRIHVMFGDVSAWFYKTLAGLQPDDKNPGFKHFIVKPYFAPDLTWVKAEYNSLYGLISSAWERQNGRITLHVKVPVNTSASIYLPVMNDVITVVDEKGAAIADLGTGKIVNGCTVFEVGSGSYSFSTKDLQ